MTLLAHSCLSHTALNNRPTLLNIIQSQSMENQTSKETRKESPQFQKDPYAFEYTLILGSSASSLDKEQDFYLLNSYCLSKKVKELVFAAKMHPHISSQHQLEQILQSIFRNEQVSKYVNFLKSRQNQYNQKSPKDRKTSFFRTVLKHLKNTRSSRSISGKILRSPTLLQLQFKLSHNTISKEIVEELVSKFGSEIIEYLESPQVYIDIMRINKSKVNKAFYILHLEEIAAWARTNHLAEYPFFAKRTLNEEIKLISRALFNQRQQGIMAKTKNNKLTQFSTAVELEQNSPCKTIEQEVISGDNSALQSLNIVSLLNIFGEHSQLKTEGEYLYFEPSESPSFLQQ